MMTHDAPPACNAGPNLLKLSESAFVQNVRRAVGEYQALERKPSNA